MIGQEVLGGRLLLRRDALDATEVDRQRRVEGLRAARRRRRASSSSPLPSWLWARGAVVVPVAAAWLWLPADEHARAAASAATRIAVPPVNSGLRSSAREPERQELRDDGEHGDHREAGRQAVGELRVLGVVRARR